MAVDLAEPFRPLAPVFDGNVALGRRHDRRTALDTPAALLAEMDRCGVERALVYHPHAAQFCSREGNPLLSELIAGQPRLAPQYVANPITDDLETFAASLHAAGVRSVRMCPRTNLFPFTRWAIGPWLDWLQREGLALWLPAGDVDARDAYETLSAYPALPVVLVGAQYSQLCSILPLLRALPNLHLDLSCWDLFEGPRRVYDLVGAERMLYGSNLPEFEPGSYLFCLHRCGFTEKELRAICGGNLERLLGMAGPKMERGAES